jgi:hypothetical protein
MVGVNPGGTEQMAGLNFLRHVAQAWEAGSCFTSISAIKSRAIHRIFNWIGERQVSVFW